MTALGGPPAPHDARRTTLLGVLRMLRPGRRARTVLLVTVSILASMVSATQAWPSTGSGAVLGLTAVGVGIWVGVLVVRRNRAPGRLVVVSTVASLVLRIDVVGAMIGTAALARRGEWRRAAAAAAVLAVASAVVFWRDFGQPPAAQTWSFRDPDGIPTSAPWHVYLTLWLLSVLWPLVAGYLSRQRAIARDAAARTSASEEVSTTLRSELGRVEERELLAREIHDTVAHRLSLLSLHAAALERVAGDPDVEELARAVRADAHGSLDEMRDLIAMMRTPGGLAAAQEARRPASLDEIGPLLEECRRASGSPATSSVHLTDASRLSPPVARAAHRVLQESLTNLRKHATPGVGHVAVTASPQTGVTLLARNPLTKETAQIPGAGRGLEGLRERVALLGGTFDAGPRGEEFVLEMWLPWSEVRAAQVDDGVAGER